MTEALVEELRASAASYRRMADSAVRMSGPTAVLGEAGQLRKAADRFDAAADHIEAISSENGRAKTMLRHLLCVDFDHFTEHDECLLESVLNDARALLRSSTEEER